MNAQAEAALASFVSRLDNFLVACSRYEESGAWDVEKLMEQYSPDELNAAAFYAREA